MKTLLEIFEENGLLNNNKLEIKNMKRDDKETKKTLASTAGKIAFQAGHKRIPSNDKNLLTILKTLKVGESVEILLAWLKAWDSASLKQREIEDIKMSLGMTF